MKNTQDLRITSALMVERAERSDSFTELTNLAWYVYGIYTATEDSIIRGYYDRIMSRFNEVLEEMANAQH